MDPPELQEQLERIPKTFEGGMGLFTSLWNLD